MPANESTLRFKFNPTQHGLGKVLGPLESQIMAVVWRRDQATAADVHQELKENRAIAYTTVMTTMSRLFEKNMLHRRKIGVSFLYTPTLDEDAFVNYMVRKVMDSLVSEFGEPVFRYVSEYVSSDAERHAAMSQVLGTAGSAKERNN